MEQKKIIKPISRQISSLEISSRDGWRFGLGFFAAAIFWFVIVLPAVAILVTIILVFFGTALGSLLG